MQHAWANAGITIQGMAPYLQVYDMPRALSFYRDKLGFDLVMQSQPERGDDCGFALLRLNEIELMLNTIYDPVDKPATEDATRRSGHTDVVLYFGSPDIDAIYEELCRRGVQFTNAPHITGYGFKAIHCTDPDGYGICFHWPNS